MRSLFTLIGFGTVAFVGLGYYFDWYHLSRQPASSSGTQRFQVDLNPGKMTEDVKKGIEQGSEIVDKLRQENSQSSPAAPAAPEKSAQSGSGAAASDTGDASKFFSPTSAAKSDSTNR